MDEYIRKADAVDALDELRVNGLDAENGLLLLSGIAAASDTIESLKPADVVPVVRCKDCKYNATTHKCLNPDSFFFDTER